MKNIFLLSLSLACLFGTLTAVEREGFVLHEDLAQYKGSDYANVVHVARGISLEEAFDIAESNPDIDYFVYLKGWRMELEIPSDVTFDCTQDPFGLVTTYMYQYSRIFYHGDTVFFKKEGVWLGTAPGLADTYFKE